MSDAPRVTSVGQWLNAKDYRRKQGKASTSTNGSSSSSSTTSEAVAGPLENIATSRSQSTGPALDTAAAHTPDRLPQGTTHALTQHGASPMTSQTHDDPAARHTLESSTGSPDTAAGRGAPGPGVGTLHGSLPAILRPVPVAVSYTGGQRASVDTSAGHELAVSAATLPAELQIQTAERDGSSGASPAPSRAGGVAQAAQLETGAGTSARVRAAALAALAYKQRKQEGDGLNQQQQDKPGGSHQEENQAPQGSVVGAAVVVRASGDVYAGRNRRVLEDAPMLLCPP